MRIVEEATSLAVSSSSSGALTVHTYGTGGIIVILSLHRCTRRKT